MLLKIYFVFSVLLFGAVKPYNRADANVKENITRDLLRKRIGGIILEDYIATAVNDMALPNVSNNLNLLDLSRLISAVQDATENILHDLTKGMRNTTDTPSVPKLINVQVVENILRETVAIVTYTLMRTLTQIL
ncbi:unnamed protein product [Euphydryas editha]|uniref:Uncharacterized protein n=1 Tax=Euphydryas editha TaxID=104508 RepID=A0AAU9V103_EUPED|nr:unnamed protein product [Euphydryas editha]